MQLNCHKAPRLKWDHGITKNNVRTEQIFIDIVFNNTFACIAFKYFFFLIANISRTRNFSVSMEHLGNGKIMSSTKFKMP